MKLLILACLVALCAAQIPNRPKFATSFCATGEVEKHVTKETRFGKFDLCRDQVKQMEVLNITYMKTADHPEETEKRLLRYDDPTKPHMAYFLRGQNNCIKEARNVTSKLPEFFNWVDSAIYEGNRRIKEVIYDFWGTTVADVRFEIAVDKNNSTQPPFYYNRLSVEDFVKYSFMTFKPMTPDSKEFAVPATCSMP